MKLVRKIAFIALALALTFTVFPLSGCGGGKTALTVLHYRPEDEAYYDWMIAQFESENNVKVQYDSVDTQNYYNALESKMRADSVDVFGIWPGSLFRDDTYLPYMMDLSDMDFLDKLEDEYLSCVTYTDGKRYGAPVSFVSNTVFYNKAIFREFGIEIPTDYSGFIEVCETLKSKSADFGNGGNMVNGVELAAPIIFGGNQAWPVRMTYNSIEAAVVRSAYPEIYIDIHYNQTLDYGHELITETFTKYKNITGYYQLNSFALSYARVPGLFAQGKYAMLIDGSWSYSQIMEAATEEFEIGAFPLPANDSAEYKDVAVSKPGVGFAVHKNTANAELARKFIEFMYRTDVYQRFLDEIKVGSTVKGMKCAVDGEMIDAMYTGKTFISPYSEYIISSMSYPTDVCEQVALGGRTVVQAVQRMNEYLTTSKSQTTSAILDRWMALSNKDYVKP